MHESVINQYGGLTGVKSRPSLLSALDRAPNAYAYGVEDVFDLAAEYAFGIVKAHAFNDGNKRTAWATSIMFLMANGLTPDITHEEGFRLIVGLADGSLPSSDASAYFRSICLIDLTE